MTAHSGEAPLDVFHRYVYEGLWQNQGEPAHRSLIWTLRDAHALAVLAAFTLLLTFAQRQSWGLIRHFLAQWKKSVRLLDHNCSNPLEHLSQLNVIKETALMIKTSIRNIQSRRRNVDILDTTLISPYFGVFSLINILLFISAGIVAPWLLSEGWVDRPLVRSRFTEECYNSTFTSHFTTMVAELPKVDAVFRECLNQFGTGCEERFHIKSPRIDRVLIDACPFQKEICVEGARSLVLAHRNFTMFEAGLNIRSEFAMGRRLTCAPINLEPFLTISKTNKVLLTIQNDFTDDFFMSNYTMILDTINGPNRYSNESSGLKTTHLPSDVTILPDWFAGSEMRVDHGLQAKLNPSFQREDGLPFLIIWRGGNTRFIEPVDDPIFSAHQNVTNHRGNIFYSDQEATGLGCVEQLQYCFPKQGRCSEWGQQSRNADIFQAEAARELMNRIAPKKDDYVEFVRELTMYELIYNVFSPYYYLSFQNMFSEVQPSFRNVGEISNLPHKGEEWIFQAENWFHKSYLHGIFWIQNGARWNLKKSILELPPKDRKPFISCDRILFRDSEYTNINFLGLCLTSVFLSLLCVSDRLVKLTRFTATKMKEIATRSFILLRQLQGKCEQAFIAAREKTVAALARNQTAGDSEGRFRNLTMSLRRVASFTNEWISRSRRPMRPSCDAELDSHELNDLRANGPSSDQSNLSRFEEIDNVI